MTFINKNCKEPIPTGDASKALAMCKMIRAVLENDPNRAILSHENTWRKALDRLALFT